MRRNYHTKLWGEIITGNYEEKLSQEIMRRNYHRKLSASIYRGVRSCGAQCAYAPPVSKQVGHMPPPEIWNSMFLPQMKKAVRGSRLQGTSGDLPTFNIFPSSKIHCYNHYLFLSKLNLPYQICVGFIFINQKSLKYLFKTGFLSLKSPFKFNLLYQTKFESFTC